MALNADLFGNKGGRNVPPVCVDRDLLPHSLYGIEIEIDAGQSGQVAHIEQYGTPWVNHE